MERALRPERFESVPNTAISAKEFSHWLRTFENFVGVLPQDGLNKLNVLINFLSPSVFDYISECNDYKEAIDLLKGIYIKPVNEVFARHLLSSRKQRSGESLDEYLQNLKVLSKECNFKAVDAIEHKEQYIRDAFIAGIQSNQIRQRLLEKSTIILNEVFVEARTLEAAQKNVESFNDGSSHLDSNLNALQIDDAKSSAAVKNQDTTDKQRCWNCGNDAHAKMKCPAKNESCFSCGRKGHFSKYCHSKSKQKVGENSKSTTTSASVYYPLLA